MELKRGFADIVTPDKENKPLFHDAPFLLHCLFLLLYLQNFHKLMGQPVSLDLNKTGVHTPVPKPVPFYHIIKWTEELLDAHDYTRLKNNLIFSYMTSR